MFEAAAARQDSIKAKLRSRETFSFAWMSVRSIKPGRPPTPPAALTASEARERAGYAQAGVHGGRADPPVGTA
eukprot:6789083-Prymnesium_polylepis.1